MSYSPGEKPTQPQVDAVRRAILMSEPDNEIATAWLTLLAAAPHQAFCRALRDAVLLRNVAYPFTDPEDKAAAPAPAAPAPAAPAPQAITVPAATLTIIEPGAEPRSFAVSGHGATPIKKAPRARYDPEDNAQRLAQGQPQRRGTPPRMQQPNAWSKGR